MIVIKRLDTAELIEDACALLYTVHFEEGGWKFAPDNPSQLRVEIKDNRKLLVDRFTDDAIWFGAFDNSKLMGCARLTFIDENNELEMEAYKSSAVIQQYLPKDKSRCAEIARCAILQSKNSLGIRISDLFLAAFRYCEENEYSICAASHNVYIISLFKKIGYPLKKECAFRYEEQDLAPVNFYFADYAKAEVRNMILNLENYKKDIRPNNSKMLDALETVAPILPTVVYWHDTQGVILGVNPHCLKSIGATTDIIGKTPYDFYPKEIAEHILSHNELVMKTGEILSQDEAIEDVSTGEVKIFHSTKAPLYNDAGKVIGIIGSSIEVTAEKEAERLKIENEKQKTLLIEQEKFTKVANKVSHDIRSPLSSLLMIVKNCQQIPEPQRIALREAATGIRDIANHLLNQYMRKESNNQETENHDLLLVSTVLLELLTAKKYQYEGLAVKFDCHFEDNTHFVFIRTEFSDFRRMISNLINNAVDALENGKGTISLHLSADNEWVKVSIQDTGKGMSPDLIAKIMNKTSVTEGKKEGHGIGLTQVWETLDKNRGKMHIDSVIGKGSNLTLTFPRASVPNWIAEEIVLNSDDTVVVLDDDSSIHGAWQTRFETILDEKTNIKRKHFRKGIEALEFIYSLSPTEKNHLFLLSDYELLQQELNGLHIIEKSGVSRSILVTSHYVDPLVQEKAFKTGTKILPKQLASEVPIKIIKVEQSITKDKTQNSVDVVLVEDDEHLSDNMVNYVFSDKVVDQYRNPEDLLENLHRYSKDTKIYLDQNYDNSWLKGMDLAKELHEKGYKRLYVLSGEVFNEKEIPPYVTAIWKCDLDALERSKDD